jgi:GntR family transcriptional regulator, transcriptional repressor for pyruvate dehydrogenase complex
MNFIIEFHRDTSVREMLEVRRILEPAASVHAAVRVSADDIAGLEQVLSQATPESSVEDLMQADVEFHPAHRGGGRQHRTGLLDRVAVRANSAGADLAGYYAEGRTAATAEPKGTG